MHVLVCGGAGYIGSHMCKWLAMRGFQVTVLDNLSTGHRKAVKWGALVQADLLRPETLEPVFDGSRIDAVMHFAARSLVGESMARPYEYYAHNVGGTLNLLDAMRRHGVDRLVFSSTAAVFGEPQANQIDEHHPTVPMNPYGASKLMVERMLADAAKAHGLRSVALRYFNAAGASPDGDIGESHEPETHLIPSVLMGALRRAPPPQIFGDDYPTGDGTCVRDYVHVDDLAQAHLLALDYLDVHTGAHAFNLGNGRGFSVREVIQVASSVTGQLLKGTVTGRRAGDPAVLVASSEKARAELGWAPVHTTLASIIDSAWHWHQAQAY